MLVKQHIDTGDLEEIAIRGQLWSCQLHYVISLNTPVWCSNTYISNILDWRITDLNDHFIKAVLSTLLINNHSLYCTNGERQIEPGIIDKLTAKQGLHDFSLHFLLLVQTFVRHPCWTSSIKSVRTWLWKYHVINTCNPAPLKAAS